ncbi:MULTISPECIES: hypothetical protein [unclassified Exiguobacterium]|uniref:hypothetical protein n=1 Tax=unclassified Exiguobacterium TaxID=2644629 RepID=UPI001BE9E3DF|nr:MULTISPECIES: hypothetical protein [unclassified Exiguobacterium]
MDLMWILILFGLFMFVLFTVFVSSSLQVLFKQIHPFVHVIVMLGLFVLYDRILDHPQLIWILAFLVIISYSSPLMMRKLYAKGERMEQERSK